MGLGVVGYGSCGFTPPNSVDVCFEAFDQGADAAAVDVCETSDGVVVVANPRALRVLALGTPSWDVVKEADLGAAFGRRRSRHRVLRLADFFQAMGPLPIHLVIDAELKAKASEELRKVVASRTTGETTVLASAEWLGQVLLPGHIPRILLLHGVEEVFELAGVRVDGVAATARSLPSLERLRVPKVALRCDTRAAVAAARFAGVRAVYTERPGWLRAVWDEPRRPSRLFRAPFL